MNIDFSDFNLKESNVRNMQVIDSCYYDGLVELRTKANKYYICSVWESSGEFTIVARFNCKKQAMLDFNRYKNKVA